VPDGVRPLPVDLAPSRRLGSIRPVSDTEIHGIQETTSDASADPHGDDDRFGTMRAMSVPGSDPEAGVEHGETRRILPRESSTPSKTDPAIDRVGRNDDGRRR
jgi:hypothetical protein